MRFSVIHARVILSFTSHIRARPELHHPVPVVLMTVLSGVEKLATRGRRTGQHSNDGFRPSVLVCCTVRIVYIHAGYLFPLSTGSLD